MEIKTVKGQFFIDFAELKNAKYNFWLEKAEFQIMNHRRLDFSCQSKILKLQGM